MKKRFLAGAVLTLAIGSAFGGAMVGQMTKPDTHSEMLIAQALTKSETKTVQTKLKRWGYYTGSIDGIFGPQTKKAVRYFQSKNGLVVDGIVGKTTSGFWAIIFSSDDFTFFATSQRDIPFFAKTTSIA